MQHGSFSFKCQVKQVPEVDDGAFEGLLAVYNTLDLGGDMIAPGAFSRTIQNQGSTVPLLWQHQPDQPIGTLTLEDTPQALKVKGQLLLGLPMAREAHQLLKAKVIKGLSFGYDVIRDAVENNVRVLKEVRLWEGSIVTFPMNPAAMVQAIKSVGDDDREIIETIKALTLKAERAASGAPTQRTVRRGR